MANTLSLLVRQQLPEYIRSDYDTFVEFVESYYEWMDQTGNVIDLGKNIPTYMDLDTTLDAFIEFFVKQFLPLFPPDRLENPTFFIQHAKELYRAKGTAKATRLFFRLLYGQDIDLFYPKESVLRASTSGWTNTPSLRLDPTIWTIQFGDGANTRFRALDTSMGATATVYLNGVLQVAGYAHSPNEPFITFTTPPTLGTEIKVTYDGEDLIDLFDTRTIIARFIGQTSGASAVSESLQQIISENITQLDLRVSSVTGTYTQYEVVRGRWVYDIDTHEYLDIYGRLVSYLAGIELIDGGLSYNVGDPVIITGGFPANAATAVVESVFDALISNITVIDGGVGYQPGQACYITSMPNTGLNVFILSVDTSEAIHPNSYPINQDVINLWADTIMSNGDFYFTPGVSENVNTVMEIAFTDFILGKHPIERVGPISTVTITSSTQVFNPAPTLAINPPIIVVTGNNANGNVATANVPLDYFGIMGRMNVQFGGSGYQVDDEVNFENIPGMGFGIGGAAEVTSVHLANTGIKTVNFRPARITGNVTVNTAISNVQVVGVGTFFTTDLSVNTHIEINSESTYVSSITNNTHLIVNTAFSRSSTLRKLGRYGKYFVGGMNYRANSMPIVTVSSGNPFATGAQVVVELIISSGAEFLLEPQTEEPVGKIRTIRITNHGYGYQTPPIIDLSGSGNGKANAVAIMLSNIFNAPGRFQTTEGFLSSDRKLQNDGYYTTFSYVVRSQTALDKYKTILKDLVHPAGLRLWGEYVITDEIAAPTFFTSNGSMAGDVWVQEIAASNASWQSVKWNDTVFAAVAQSEGAGEPDPLKRVMTSPDGITWTIRSANSADSWQSVAWNGTLFAAVAYAGQVMTSPDGITWTGRTSPVQNWKNIAWNGTVFCAVALDRTTTSTIMTSPDGITWTIRTASAAREWVWVEWNGTVFCAVSSTAGGADPGSVMTSPDGITWTNRTGSITTHDWESVAWNGTLFVAIGSGIGGTKAMSSPDGITWTTRIIPTNFNNWRILGVGTRFVGVSNGVIAESLLTSPDGITWTLGSVAPAVDNSWQALAYNGTTLVAVASSSYIDGAINDMAMISISSFVTGERPSVNIANLFQTTS